MPFIHYDVRVNFAPELKQLIRETRYLERMGISIPDAALNVTLQESGYYSNMERLESALASWSECLESLSEIEKTLLSHRISSVALFLKPGLATLNWNSLAIDDFIVSCNKSVKEFQDVVHQIQKNAAMYLCFLF